MRSHLFFQNSDVLIITSKDVEKIYIIIKVCSLEISFSQFLHIFFSKLTKFSDYDSEPLPNNWKVYQVLERN
jgi:hypothetical protein